MLLETREGEGAVRLTTPLHGRSAALHSSATNQHPQRLQEPAMYKAAKITKMAMYNSAYMVLWVAAS